MKRVTASCDCFCNGNMQGKCLTKIPIRAFLPYSHHGLPMLNRNQKKFAQLVPFLTLFDCFLPCLSPPPLERPTPCLVDVLHHSKLSFHLPNNTKEVTCSSRLYASSDWWHGDFLFKNIEISQKGVVQYRTAWYTGGLENMYVIPPTSLYIHRLAPGRKHMHPSALSAASSPRRALLTTRTCWINVCIF